MRGLQARNYLLTAGRGCGITVDMQAALLNTNGLPDAYVDFAIAAVEDAELNDPTLAAVEASLSETCVGFPGLSVMRWDGRVVLAYHGQEIAEFRAQFLVTAYSGEGDAQDMDGFEYVDTLETAWAKRGEWEAMGKTVTIEEI